MTILDEALECPRCGIKTISVDDYRAPDGRVVLQLCSECGRVLDKQPLATALKHFRALVRDIMAAVDKSCPECGGSGWRVLRASAPGAGMRLQACPQCAQTGVDMDVLCKALMIARKAKPLRHAAAEGFAQAESARNKSHKG